MTIFQYPKCSTCKKALAWLKAKQLDHESIDIVKTPPSRAVLEQAAKLGKLDVKKLFNTSGESYRNGNFKERLATMSDAEAFAALAADGKLIKRPLLIAKGVALVGFKEEEWARVLTR
jgi:arsenate reductase (glutaredoxin)